MTIIQYSCDRIYVEKVCHTEIICEVADDIKISGKLSIISQLKIDPPSPTLVTIFLKSFLYL